MLSRALRKDAPCKGKALYQKKKKTVKTDALKTQKLFYNLSLSVIWLLFHGPYSLPPPLPFALPADAYQSGQEGKCFLVLC